MYPRRYFPARYFAPRYFPVGFAVVGVTQTLLLPSPDALTSPTLDLYDAGTRALVEAGLELEEGDIPHVYEVTRTGTESGIHVGILWDGVTFAGLWVVDLANATGDYVLTWASNWGVLALLRGIGAGSLSLSAAERNAIADHVRRRTQANVEASANGDELDLSSEYGFIQQAQESAVVGTNLVVKKTDGTELGTKALTTSDDADSITGIS